MWKPYDKGINLGKNKMVINITDLDFKAKVIEKSKETAIIKCENCEKPTKHIYSGDFGTPWKPQ